jgi:ABC-2 type transport system permease protein
MNAVPVSFLDTLPSGRRAGSQVMPRTRVLRAYLTEIRFELLRMMRSPVFGIPMVLLPFALYFLFGVVIAGASPDAKAHPEIANFLFTGFATFAVVGPALFGVGCALAMERDQGLLRLKRAMPTPTGGYLLAKLAMATIFSAVSAGAIAVVALLAGKITLSGAQVATIVAVLVAGTLPFSALGLFIGTRVSGSASPGVMNLVYLPMVYLSGLFFPLPKGLQSWSVIWPTLHLNRLAMAAAHLPLHASPDPRLSALVLIALTLVFGGLALRRLARVG